MYWPHREPTLWEMLSDPIVKAVMEADGVEAQEVVVLLRQLGGDLRLVHHDRPMVTLHDVDKSARCN